MILFPRAFWWTLFWVTLLDFAWNTLAFFSDRPHFHQDVAVVDLLTLALTGHRLTHPPKVKGDA